MSIVCYLRVVFLLSERCVGPQRGLSCVEGDLAAVELNIESVVLLLLVCVTMMMMIIIMTTIIMSSPVQGSI